MFMFVLLMQMHQACMQDTHGVSEDLSACTVNRSSLISRAMIVHIETGDISHDLEPVH